MRIERRRSSKLQLRRKLELWLSEIARINNFRHSKTK